MKRQRKSTIEKSTNSLQTVRFLSFSSDMAVVRIKVAFIFIKFKCKKKEESRFMKSKHHKT